MTRNKLINYRSDLRNKARQLRQESTVSEKILWTYIRKRALGYQFHRQVPMLNYIVDFYCHELRLAIEVDGSSHLGEESQKSDLVRQSRLESAGVSFVRVDDYEVRMDIQKVITVIQKSIGRAEASLVVNGNDRRIR